jgi:phosphoribosylanthranilate isomerase
MYDAVRPGSGIAWDWSSVLPLPKDIRIVLAGGLSPDNVADAILTVRPWGVDVSSGVESEPGRKDAVKVRRFIRHARDAAAAYEDGE